MRPNVEFSLTISIFFVIIVFYTLKISHFSTINLLLIRASHHLHQYAKRTPFGQIKFCNYGRGEIVVPRRGLALSVSQSTHRRSPRDRRGKKVELAGRGRATSPPRDAIKIKDRGPSLERAATNYREHDVYAALYPAIMPPFCTTPVPCLMIKLSAITLCFCYFWCWVWFGQKIDRLFPQRQHDLHATKMTSSCAGQS